MSESSEVQQFWEGYRSVIQGNAPLARAHPAQQTGVPAVEDNETSREFCKGYLSGVAPALTPEQITDLIAYAIENKLSLSQLKRRAGNIAAGGNGNSHHSLYNNREDQNAWYSTGEISDLLLQHFRGDLNAVCAEFWSPKAGKGDCVDGKPIPIS